MTHTLAYLVAVLLAAQLVVFAAVLVETVALRQQTHATCTALAGGMEHVAAVVDRLPGAVPVGHIGVGVGIDCP